MSLSVLRFKDETGQCFPDWEATNIGEILSIYSGYAFSSGDSQQSGVRWLKIADVGIQVMTPDTPSFLSLDLKNKYKKFLVYKNDYVIALTRPILNGKLKIAKVDQFYNESLLNQRVGKLITHHNIDFIYQILQLRDTVSNIANKISGTDPPNLSLNEIKSIEVNIPSSLDEQTKIANFLTAVDEKIHLLTQKHDLLTQYKKGVMQQLFSQKLRFKDDDGGDFPQWKESELGDVAEVIMGQSPDSNTYNDLGNGVPLVQGNADISNRKTSPRAWTTAPTKQCFPNDIILTVRAPVGAVAISNHNACIGRGVCAIRKNDKANSNYIYQLLLWYEPIKWSSLEQGSTFTAVSGKDIKTIDIPVPTLKEQTKIANFLTAIDDKITATQSQLQAVKQYKQGLLQQMFV